jgi:hypothetical protein
MEHEEVQLLPQPAVVPLPGLLQQVQVRVQVGLGEEGRAVDALEHLVLLAPQPIGAGHGEELEGPQAPGGGEVGTAAEVGPVSLPVDGDPVVPLGGGEVDLVGLLLALEEGDGLGLGKIDPLDGQVPGHDLPHPPSIAARS